ncbi:MAG: hypothetical protein IT445_20190 [Phycisphaeraceae bacterium]|nr:hypothetical protein [Phycisphaeraceae bacterium]
MFGRNRLWAMGFACAIAGFVAISACAEVNKDTFWIDSGGGSWDDSDNWDNGVPDSTAVANFNLGASSVYTVTLAGSTQAGEFRARSGSIDFDLNGQTLTVDNLLFIGYFDGDDASVQVSNGLMTSIWADVGHYTGSSGAPGEMTFTGPDADWINDMDMTVARGATGRLYVLAGATVTINRYSFVGNSASGEVTAADGAIEVDGEDSQMDTQRLTIGYAGGGGSTDVVGTVSLTDHATFNCTTGQAQIGVGGTGYLNIISGSTFTSHMGTSPSNSSGVIGADNGGYYGYGEVIVSGAGSQWTQDGKLSVGFTAEGILTVDDGGVVNSRWGHIARRGGSYGSAFITDEPSAWNIEEELYVGGEADPSHGGLGSGGEGYLDVRNGATVTVGQRLELWDLGHVDVTGGGRLMVGADPMPATTDRLYVSSCGLLTGTGSIVGDVVNMGGSVAPGHSAGPFFIDGDYAQSAGGSLLIQMDPAPGCDILNVTGDATLAGTLSLELLDDYVPAHYYDSFNILSAQNVAGKFDAVIGVIVSSDLALAVTYSSNAVTVTAALPGDANLDQTVNLSDLQILGDYWGATDSDWFTGDYNGDGQVNLADLQLLGDNWSGAAGDFAALSAAIIPEPAAMTLLMVGTSMFLRRQRFTAWP